MRLKRAGGCLLSLDFRKLDEIIEQVQADFLAFLRVKLRGENVVAPDGRGEVFAVIRARGDNPGIGGLGKETVDKINVAAGGNPFKQGVERKKQ